MSSLDQQNQPPDTPCRPAAPRRRRPRRPAERLLIALGTLVPPLVQIQLPWCAAAPALAVLALATLWR